MSHTWNISRCCSSVMPSYSTQAIWVFLNLLCHCGLMSLRFEPLGLENQDLLPFTLMLKKKRFINVKMRGNKRRSIRAHESLSVNKIVSNAFKRKKMASTYEKARLR